MRKIQRVITVACIALLLLVLYAGLKNKYEQLKLIKAFDCIPILYLKSKPGFKTFISEYENHYMKVINTYHAQLVQCFDEHGLYLGQQELFILGDNHRYFHILDNLIEETTSDEVPSGIIQSFNSSNSCPVVIPRKFDGNIEAPRNSFYKAIYKSSDWSIYAFVEFSLMQ